MRFLSGRLFTTDFDYQDTEKSRLYT